MGMHTFHPANTPHLSGSINEPVMCVMVVVVVERVVVVVVWCCLPYAPVYYVMDGWTHHSIPTNMLGRTYW